MREKIIKHLSLYLSFYNELDFAKKQVNEVIEWLWKAYDMEVITSEERRELNRYAISVLVELEGRGK